MNNLDATALFPTFVFSKDNSEAADFNAQLAYQIYKIRTSDPEGSQISNRGGWQSRDDLNTRDEFGLFINFVEQTMVEVKEFLDVANDLTLRVANCWANINGEGSFNTRHIHGNAFFSGVYYVKVPENSGDIRFFDPNPVRECFHLPYEKISPKNCFSHSFQPVEGRMLVFPAYVGHDVTDNKSKEERISVSFNIGAR